ncbi:MAG TPA: lysine--tRNA ligase [Chloroflexi bacterium]|mgnify:FL=1|jgi:lysyl-tRNA synthetase class 2|nr:lysine--tRNA ligase [Chloroflexota bacterium]HCG30584.1 lysine--tRNA ligase [Chloroflexota bacterium]
MEMSEQQLVRLAKVDALREQGIEPYPARSTRTHTASDVLVRYESGEGGWPDGRDPEQVAVVGRVMSFRQMGKATFAHIEDGHGRLQVYLRANIVGVENYDRFIHMVDLGDFIEVAGHLFRTRAGEVTVEAASWTMLSKAVTPPPEKWHGLTDTELRYRQRSADLFSNPGVRSIFVTRARMITALRRFLDGEGFLEVETPTLQPIYGGAHARPFTTYHNALDQTLYLRIADELYLKRLIVGGFERVYEICKDFRNEGVDTRHNPEFTQLEFYMAYADYRDVMDLTERMVSGVAQEVRGTTQITYDGHEIDLAPPWRRLRMADAIFEATGIDFTKVRDQQTLYELARERGADVEPTTVWPRIVDELMKTFVRPHLIQPTFLIDYPVELSPLAKQSPESERIVERFQVFIGGIELCNAYSELNDPMDQMARFLEQAQDRAQGDEEAMPIDEDYVRSLMYGMPPTGGFGIGVDRLAMLLTDQQSIREVILFPQLRTRSAHNEGSHH